MPLSNDRPPRLIARAPVVGQGRGLTTWGGTPRSSMRTALVLSLATLT
jgi:hypothetical protein